MKETKVMLAVVAVFLTTWLLLSLGGWLVSDGVTYKACVVHPGTLTIMLIFGWIPAVIVGSDYWKRLNGED